MASLRSCAIAHHLELKERSGENFITKLKKELARLKASHTGEVRSLEEKVKEAEDKYSVGQKEWKAQEKELQDKVTSLEKKFKEHKDFYATEVTELKNLLKAKIVHQ